MSGSIHEQVSEELKRAKAEGSLRADRIKEIVKAAVSQAIAELKEGSGEVGTIARDVVQAVSDEVKGKSQSVASDIRASVEGVVEGISETRREAIAKNQEQIQVLEVEVVEQERLLQEEVENALVKIETDTQTNGIEDTDLKATIASILSHIRDSEAVANMKAQYARLKAKLAVLDANLASRYGDRYDEVKRHLDSAKAWYDNAKTSTEAGDKSVVQEKYTEFEQRLGELGTALASKEKQIKERLTELWKTTSQL
ncbi:MAG: histidine kinase [Cyanobacteria bacterium J06638_22]